MQISSHLRSARTLLEVLYPGSFTVLPIGAEEVVTKKPEKITGGLLSSKEAAEYLGVSAVTLRRMCKYKTITFIRVTPKRFRFNPADLELFKRSRTNQSKTVGKF